MENLLTYETKHYIFHYKKDSVAQKDIVDIANTQEKSFEEITNTLRLEHKQRIDYFLYDTPEEVGIAYGDNDPCNGFASDERGRLEIHAVYNQKVKCIGPHEDAHIISYSINKPASCALREGLAMYFDKTWWGVDNDIWTSLYIEKGKYQSLLDLIIDDKFYEIPCEISYPIVGSFTKYIIEKYSVEKYIEFYGDKEILWKKHFGMPLADMEKEFVNKIKQLAIAEEVRNKK